MKYSTLCWECKWAAGKDEKCPWVREFEPVPGWKAVPSKIRMAEKENGYIDSFDVYECPLFEPVRNRKAPIVVAKISRAEKERLVKKLRFEENKTIIQIANDIGCDMRTVYYILRKIKGDD